MLRIASEYVMLNIYRGGRLPILCIPFCPENTATL